MKASKKSNVRKLKGLAFFFFIFISIGISYGIYFKYQESGSLSKVFSDFLFGEKMMIYPWILFLSIWLMTRWYYNTLPEDR